ncbi:MAG TPA: hypothetical protein VIX87_05605 [Steroidobacteraceae bacterium]
MARKKSAPLRSPRARGLRTLQHQRLSPKIRHAIDTEVWLRGLLCAALPGADAGWATKDRVHDEALTWFLQQHAHKPVEHYPARRTGDEDLTFWLDSRLMERARRVAMRDGVKIARLIDAALGAFVGRHIPEALLDFRRRVQADALEIYASMRGGIPPAAKARRGGARTGPRTTG